MKGEGPRRPMGYKGDEMGLLQGAKIVKSSNGWMIDNHPFNEIKKALDWD